jgi:hypothetical protein
VIWEKPRTQQKRATAPDPADRPGPGRRPRRDRAARPPRPGTPPAAAPLAGRPPDPRHRQPLPQTRRPPPHPPPPLATTDRNQTITPPRSEAVGVPRTQKVRLM